MDISVFLKSVIDTDSAPVVICDLEHIIVYMNPSAVSHYEKWGGDKLMGKSLLDCHNSVSVEKFNRVVDWFKMDKNNNRIFTFHNKKENKDVYMIALRDEKGDLIGYYEKHEYRNKETTTLYGMN
ncbi:MAG: fatty acid/phospholipid synthesis protein PlsX [Oscillospiraceae bacterium]|nr:fatty acid/phospholipid synthesis protein PlsX [Oscillospiraceae bacterium]